MEDRWEIKTEIAKEFLQFNRTFGKPENNTVKTIVRKKTKQQIFKKGAKLLITLNPKSKQLEQLIKGGHNENSGHYFISPKTLLL